MHWAVLRTDEVEVARLKSEIVDFHAVYGCLWINGESRNPMRTTRSVDGEAYASKAGANTSDSFSADVCASERV